MEHAPERSALLAPALALGLALLAGGVYAPAVRNGFSGLDDALHVTPHVLAGLNLENLLRAFLPNPSTLWHPLTWLSLMADATLFGPGPAGFHTTSVALHAGNAALFFLLLQAATRAPWPSALAAALFAVHPAHVESVAWISARKDVLSLLFLLLSLAAYARYVRRPSPGRYALLAAAFALALMAKPSAAALPVLLLVLDAWPLGRIGLAGLRGLRQAWAALRPLLLEKLPLLAMAGACYWLNTAFGALPSQVLDAEAIPAGLRLGNAAVSLWAYLGTLLWPLDLAVFYPFPAAISPVRVAAALLALLPALALLARFGTRRGWPAAGAAWYVLALLPVLGLFQHGFLPARADRYAYVPFLGAYLLLAFGSWTLLRDRRLGRPCWFAASLAGVALLIPLTRAQIALWGDTAALFRHAEAVVPGNWPAATFLGNELRRLRQYPEAAAAYHRALAARPDHGAALNGLGLALEAMGQADQALEAMREAARLNPGHPMGYYNLGSFLLRRGLLDEAEANLRRAAQLAPDRAYARQGLGQLHLRRGRPEEAGREFRAAREMDPGYPGVSLGLGQVAMKSGQYAEAVQELARELPVSPGNSELHASLGFSLAHLNRYEEALSHFREAARLRPDAAASWFNLGVVLARAGQRDQARQALERALVLEPGFGRARDALEKLRRESGAPDSPAP